MISFQNASSDICHLVSCHFHVGSIRLISCHSPRASLRLFELISSWNSSYDFNMLFHLIAVHFISFDLLSFNFIGFDFIPRVISFQCMLFFISLHFVWFHFIWFHFVSLRAFPYVFISFGCHGCVFTCVFVFFHANAYFIWFRATSNFMWHDVDSFDFVLFHFICFGFLSLNVTFSCAYVIY